MANFVLLYSGGSMPETEAEQAAVMQAWMAWFGELGGAVVDAGNPFTPVAKSIASDGSVSEGPVGSMASGYSGVTGRSATDWKNINSTHTTNAMITPAPVRPSANPNTPAVLTSLSS